MERARCLSSPSYLDGKFVVAQQSGRVQLTPAAGGENQRVRAVTVPAEGPVHQLPDGVNLREAGARQHLLDLSRTGNREEGGGSGTEDSSHQRSFILGLWCVFSLPLTANLLKHGRTRRARSSSPSR